MATPPNDSSNNPESDLPWLQKPTTITPSSPSQKQNPQEEDLSLTAALSTITPSSFLTVHQTPCARTGLLTGIGLGSAVGILRSILGLPIPRAANWAVGTGALTAILQYEYCQAKRRQEKAKVARVVEVYGQKQAEMRAKEEEDRRRKAEEERRLLEEQKGKSWWKVW